MKLPSLSRTPHPGIEWLRRYVRVTPGWNDLYGQSPTWDDFFARIRQYPIDQALLHLSQVNGVLARHNGIEGQAGLCRELFYPDGEKVWSCLERFEKRLRIDGARERPHLFYPAQVLMTAKLSLAYQSPEFSVGANSMRPLGEALLMLTDLLQSKGTGKLEDILPEMMASHLFTFSDVPLNALGRSFELYMSDHPELHRHDSYVNLPAELERITGLSPVLLWLMLFAAYGKLSARPASECGHPFNLNQYLTTPWETEAGATKPAFTEQEVERVANLLVATIPQVSAEIADLGFSHTTARLHDVTEFAKYPLIRHAGKDLCMFDELLFKKLTAGVHHLFLHPDRTTRQQRNRYLRFTGAMFERYADGILRRCFGGQEGTYSGLLPNRDESCCDALWHCGDALVLFELKAGQLDRNARTGSGESLMAKLEDLVFKPAFQMDSTIQLFKAGQLPIGGTDPERVHRFFPISVTLEPLTMEPAMHDQVLGAVRDRGLLHGEGVRPLQIMNVAELEHLEVGMSRGLKLLHILAKKLDMPEWSRAGFRNFFLYQYPDRFKGARNPHLCAIVEGVRERAFKLLRERLDTQ